MRTGDAGSTDVAIGIGGTQSELIAWTGQASAPVVAWNDERPRSIWIDQLQALPGNDPQREFWTYLGSKYGYGPAAPERAIARIVAVLEAIGGQRSGC